MKKYILFFFITILLYSCDKDNYIDTGLSNGRYNGTVWEYLHSNHEWDSAIVIIERAGLTGIFDGTDPEYKDGITFFGFTNFTVWQFLAYTVDDEDNRIYKSIRDIPADMCRQMVLDYVVKGKRMKESFGYEIRGTMEGGTEVMTASGKTLRVYRNKTNDPYTGEPDKGPEGLSIHAIESGHIAAIASADNQADNGVVHSLTYEFQWTEL